MEFISSKKRYLQNLPPAASSGCRATKKQSALTENISIKTNCSLFTLIIFSEHTYFLRKSQITPERKQRKKIFFNSICTPLEHPDSPQSLYLWAFSQFSPLLKLYRSWRFARQIVEYSVYAFDFVDDSVHNFIKYFVW